jgi:hypothetical protein
LSQEHTQVAGDSTVQSRRRTHFLSVKTGNLHASIRIRKNTENVMQPIVENARQVRSRSTTLRCQLVHGFGRRTKSQRVRESVASDRFPEDREFEAGEPPPRGRHSPNTAGETMGRSPIRALPFSTVTR